MCVIVLNIADECCIYIRILTIILVLVPDTVKKFVICSVLNLSIVIACITTISHFHNGI